MGKRTIFFLSIAVIGLFLISIFLGYLVSREQAKKSEENVAPTAEVSERVEVTSSPIDSIGRYKVSQMTRIEGTQKLVLKNPTQKEEDTRALKEVFPDAGLREIPATSEHTAIAGLFEKIEGGGIVIINAGFRAKIGFTPQTRLWLVEDGKTYIISGTVNESYLKKGDLILALNAIQSPDGYTSSWLVNFH